MSPTATEYRAWAEFRHQIRLWLRLSEEAARDEGIPPQHHQVLLAIRGFPEKRPPLITDLAERLQLRHHSVVGLIDRMEATGLIERHATGIGRGVEVVLTHDGNETLDRVSARLRPQLKRAADLLIDSLTPLTGRSAGRARSAAPVPAHATGRVNGARVPEAKRGGARTAAAARSRPASRRPR